MQVEVGKDMEALEANMSEASPQHLCPPLTDARLDVGVVAPLAVPLTLDGGLVVPRAGVPPPLPSAVVPAPVTRSLL